jgi:hypothetical protein
MTTAFVKASAAMEKLTDWLGLARSLADRGDEEDAVTVLRGAAAVCEAAECAAVVESAERELVLPVRDRRGTSRQPITCSPTSAGFSSTSPPRHRKCPEMRDRRGK